MEYENVLSHLSSPPPWSSQNESVLLEPYAYVLSMKGGELRSKLIEAFNLWIDVPIPKLTIITRIVDMFHTSSLLVDDIEDNSQLRRGKPAAHKIYGIPQTFNAATYVWFLALQELITLRASDVETHGQGHKLDAIVIEELLSLHRGQGLEIYWRDSLRCPTEEEYISVANNKTGGLLRMSIKLMMACSAKQVDMDYIPLIDLIGIHYQIRNDLVNLCGTENAYKKGFADDLTEGKFSFPIIHSIHTNSTNHQILNVLQKRSEAPDLKKHVIEYMRTETKSFDYTLNVLNKIEIQIREEIRRLGGNVMLERIVDHLSSETSKEAQSVQTS